eukprot:3148374-Pleurochrysis_carterae.AAC.1
MQQQSQHAIRKTSKHNIDPKKKLSEQHLKHDGFAVVGAAGCSDRRVRSRAAIATHARRHTPSPHALAVMLRCATPQCLADSRCRYVLKFTIADFKHIYSCSFKGGSHDPRKV